MNDPRAYRDRARALDAAARHHKREAGRHRRAARNAREQLAGLRRKCAELGISLDINGEGTDPWPKSPSSTSRH